ncbi:MAG: peptidylprolyl isomerase [Oscillospiraceae bacterium]|nr:peptidylprolyl isomerase [Oscillospiraceae bacterium]
MKKIVSALLAVILFAIFALPVVARQVHWNENNPTVSIVLTTGEVIVIELSPAHAPNTVNNFLRLVNEGFYDGLIFHRAIPDFVIQGGCPLGIGTGGTTPIPCEPNAIAHVRGVVSMAHAGRDTGSSQFFIMHGNSAPWLDGVHTAFGFVVSGMEVVDRIANLPTNVSGRPLNPPVIAEMTVGYRAVPWWQTMPAWLQWILRWIFFGWIWM